MVNRKKWSEHTLALDAYLKRASYRGHDRKRGPRHDIGELTCILRDVGLSIGDEDLPSAIPLLDLIPAFAELLLKPVYAGHRAHLENLRHAIEAGSKERSLLHLARLQKIVRVVASDMRPAEGATVAVKRTRHHWSGGRVTGRVVASDGPGLSVLDDEGAIHEVEHVRDVRHK